ncbi:MAG: non-canonical purine NTP pyrophosphatase [Patescibacteria group bacterium]
MEIILSTRNRSKIDQIKALLNGLDIQVLSLDEAGIEGEAVEDGATLEENAFKKASFASKQTGKWAIADDTGLFIDALDGKPGIHAARWAGDDLTTGQIRDFTLAQLKDVKEENRTATFTTVAVIVAPTGEKTVFSGSVKGKILSAPRAECQPNMPYSALFIPDGQSKVWAEMDVNEENRISHRGQAFRQVRDFFQSVLS